MKILFLHGLTSTPGGLKPTFLKNHGHKVLNPDLSGGDFNDSVRIAQAEFDQHQPDVIVGSSRGGAVAINIDSNDTPVVLLCPAWKNWGTATKVKSNTTIIHSEQDEVVSIDDSQELLENSGLPESKLIVSGHEHRLADEESLGVMLRACGKEQVMTEPDDLQMALMFSFFEGVFRKGPGSKESTLKAFSMLDDLPPNPRIIDFGCGSGTASLILANSNECIVTAVDIHQPFLNELQTIAARDGLANRITVVQADMADPPFPDHSFDLIWAEGAIYNIGFQDGLKTWRRLLPTGGYVAVTEVTWLTQSPPPRAVDFWQTEYPAMTSIDDNLSKVCSAGFEPVGHFVLPSKDWLNYYGPLEDQIAIFRSNHPTNNEAQSLADSLQHEIDVWRECGSSYGYVFYLGKVS